jgi:hypothetical protein
MPENYALKGDEKTSTPYRGRRLLLWPAWRSPLPSLAFAISWECAEIPRAPKNQVFSCVYGRVSIHRENAGATQISNHRVECVG